MHARGSSFCTFLGMLSSSQPVCLACHYKEGPGMDQQEVEGIFCSGPCCFHAWLLSAWIISNRPLPGNGGETPLPRCRPHPGASIKCSTLCAVCTRVCLSVCVPFCLSLSWPVGPFSLSLFLVDSCVTGQSGLSVRLLFVSPDLRPPCAGNWKGIHPRHSLPVQFQARQKCLLSCGLCTCLLLVQERTQREASQRGGTSSTERLSLLGQAAFVWA